MKKAIKLIGFMTAYVLFCFSLTSCKIELDMITFSYDELSHGLEKIAYADASGVEKGDEEKIYRILTEEEMENVLTEISNMDFETTFYGPEPNSFSGDALVFYYSTYKLYFSRTIIMKKNIDSNSEDGGYFYSINQNEDFIELLTSFWSND